MEIEGWQHDARLLKEEGFYEVDVQNTFHISFISVCIYSFS
jgi:hypothetical protein